MERAQLAMQPLNSAVSKQLEPEARAHPRFASANGPEGAGGVGKGDGPAGMYTASIRGAMGFSH